MPVRREILDWLSEAHADLRHAEASIRLGDCNWACFAAQQAAEKALSVLIMHILGFYPRGHNIVRLYSMIRGRIGLELSVDDLARLSAYYTLARYPNAGIERPSEEIPRAGGGGCQGCKAGCRAGLEAYTRPMSEL